MNYDFNEIWNNQRYDAYISGSKSTKMLKAQVTASTSSETNIFKGRFEQKTGSEEILF